MSLYIAISSSCCFSHTPYWMKICVCWHSFVIIPMEIITINLKWKLNSNFSISYTIIICIVEFGELCNTIATHGRLPHIAYKMSWCGLARSELFYVYMFLACVSRWYVHNRHLWVIGTCQWVTTNSWASCDWKLRFLFYCPSSFAVFILHRHLIK